MGQRDGTVHGVVIHLIGAGLDHHYLLAGGDDGHVQVADLALLGVGVEHQLAVHQTHLQSYHRAVFQGMSEMASAAEVPMRAAISGEQS